MSLQLAIVSVLLTLPAIVTCRPPEKEELVSMQSSSFRGRSERRNEVPTASELSILHDGRDAHGRILLTQNHKKLGKIDLLSIDTAQAGAKGILKDSLGVDDAILKNKNKNHLRFVQVHGGMEIEGAALVVHVDEKGNVYGVNGEHVPTSKLPVSPTIRSRRAIKAALKQSTIPASKHRNCSKPRLTVVRKPEDGSGHLAWTCTLRYDLKQPDGSYKPFKDKIFAEAVGKPGLVTIFPQIYSSGVSSNSKPKRVDASSILSTKGLPILNGKLHGVKPDPRSRELQQYTPPVMETRDCLRHQFMCPLISDSSEAISTGDLAIDSAHNYAIATYDYFWYNHGRWSIDDNGMTLISQVHFEWKYNNAFWDGTQMTYGDGDGSFFDPLSQDADVVAHELTHGVTEWSSGLIYQNEPGALNEAMSDIFGALVDKQEGATGADLWLLGEDIFTPGTPGDGLRNMADPEAMNDYDWWPTRYQGPQDYGGVHWNSGIANLAFSLLVGMVKDYNIANGNNQGGENKHPRGKSDIVVPIMSWEDTADVFYEANVNCLTPGSNFAAARYCTADVHGGDNSDIIHLAWDAVGVPNDPPPPPPPPITLDPNGENGGIKTGLSADTGNMQQYLLPRGTVSEGSTVTCRSTGNNGDADIYLAFDRDPQPNPYSPVNECASYSSNSNEECTTSQAPADGTMFIVLIHAWSGYTGLTLECWETLT